MKTIGQSLYTSVRGGALVLLYHRATTLAVDPWRLAVSPGHLDEHLDVLNRYTRPTTVSALRRTLDAGRIPAGTVVVTFDDGYADLATAIKPRLQSAGVPAAMFLVSAAIDREGEFWWDSVERAILREGDLPARLTVTAGREEQSWQVHSRPRPVLHREVWTFLRGQRPAVRDRAAGELLAWAGLAPEGRSSHRTLTSAELADLAAEALIEIGAHTMNHAWLAGLGPAEQLEEIAGGRKQLESMVGRSVDTLAYPHGGRDDVPAQAIETVRRAGFAAGFMAVPNQVRAGSDRHALPRVFVEDMDGDQFGRLLWRQGGIRTA